MRVEFRTNALQKHYEQSTKAIRAYGPDVGRRYIQRVNILKNSADKAAVMAQKTLRCHPLTGDRKGEYAIQLTGQARLIVTFGTCFEGVRSEEVSKHYDD